MFKKETVIITLDGNDMPKGFKMTELGPLPQEWRVVRLGDVAETTSGGTPSREVPEFFGGTIPWVKSGELNDTLIIKTEETITEDGLRNSNAKIFQKGTLLIAMYGATAGKVGILAIPATTNQAICAILPDTSLALQDFLFYALIRQRETLLSKRYGGAQPNLNQAIIRALPIPLPPLPEQRAIAHVLRTVQRAKEATEQVIAALKEFKKSLMRHLFTYGPVPIEQADKVELKDTEIGPIPAHWEVVRLGEVVMLTKGRKPPELLSVYKAGSQPYLTADYFRNNIAKEWVPGEYVSHFPYCSAKDVVLIWDGSKAGQIFTGLDGILASTMVRVDPKQGLTRDYLFYFLSTQFAALNTKTTGTTIPHVNKAFFLNLPIPLPPLPEQKIIAEILISLDNKIKAEENKKSALETLFKTLLHNLMTGKIRVANVE
jgi:type I restriction enzyme S subunit